MNEVFKLSGSSDLGRIALVCRVWAELTLDRLWEDLLQVDLPPLERLGNP